MFTLGTTYISLINFFKYMLNHFVSYFHYSNINKKNTFFKYFFLYNPTVEETNDVLVFKL